MSRGRSGPGGLRAGISTVGALAAWLEWVGGGRGVVSAAAHSGLAEDIAKASEVEVGEAERARWLRRESADGSGWGWGPGHWDRIESGALMASMTEFRAVDSTLTAKMMPYGRYLEPRDFWPSPLPAAVRGIFMRNARAILSAGLASVRRAA